MANGTVKTTTAANGTDSNETVDPETAQMLKQAASAPVESMPVMLGLLKAMYGRFKDNIGSANKLEEKSKKLYEKNMAEWASKSDSYHNDTAMKRIHEYWIKSRDLSHAHYHSMLKLAHAGMQRLKMTMDMMEKAIAGKKPNQHELQTLKNSLPPTPDVVFLAVKTELLTFCHTALLEIETTKKEQREFLRSHSSSTEVAPLSFLQRRQDPAPEDQLAKEMTSDMEVNFNKIAPFGKEDTAKELQDHAAKTQDTLVDAVENAEVAEIKRAVFRALTRLRAAAIKEFDTIARLETQAIDAYNDAHHYRSENPLSHLHEDEAPVETDKLKSFH